MKWVSEQSNVVGLLPVYIQASSSQLGDGIYNHVMKQVQHITAK